VGKTTTARILARALNYELPDGSVASPTIAMPVLGVHCQAIMDSRHVDVLEMDAASHNGIDDIRQINDAIRYGPASARYKVYILDEVHMVSTQGFNGLLKTLEEPPPHAKFIFATTEIRKVPITILSRCQRFDLRRIEADRLIAHLERIATEERVEADAEALAIIARAAEGSVRDSLSLLDQAIAHGGGTVRADDVRQMLGLADRTRVIEIFDALMRGDAAGALTELRAQYDAGADPATVLTDLAEFTHFVTRVKVTPAIADDRGLAEAERVRGRAFAAALSMRVLSRTWQMLFKGIPEVDGASKPIAAAEMVLVRIAYAADLPTPDEVIRQLREQTEAGLSSASSAPQGGAPVPSGASFSSRTERGGSPRSAPRAAAAASPARAEPQAAHPEPSLGPPIASLARFEDLIALAAEKRDLQLKTALERDVRLVRFDDSQLEIALEPNASKALIGELSQRLERLTGRRWIVAVSQEAGQPTIRSQNDTRREERYRGVQSSPVVQSILEKFPGAQIVAIREIKADDGFPAFGGEPLDVLRGIDSEGDVMPPAYEDNDPLDYGPFSGREPDDI
jgi:DNA polymerase-3 subunit gamma/tau